MDSILQDIRFGVRVLVKERAGSAIALAVLALGIGATTAVFCVIEAALIRPLPYSHPEQLVWVSLPSVSRPSSKQAASVVDMDLWRAQTNVFSYLATSRFDTAIVVDGHAPEQVAVSLVSADYLPLYGVTPAMGRGFTSQDERLDAPSVAMLGYRYWQTHHGGDASVLGRTIRFSDGAAEIVGVVPEQFSDTEPIWRPLQLTEERRGVRQYGVLGRLRDGVTFDQAQRELTTLATRLQREDPSYRGSTIGIDSMFETVTHYAAPTVSVLAGAVFFVLLIACVNVASLQLARGVTRGGELAIRAALGAARARLVRQLLVESLLLAVAGAALGVLLAWLFLDSLVASIPLLLSTRSPVRLDWRVLAASAALAVCTGIFFGLAPALRLSRAAPGSLLAGVTRGVRRTLSRRAGRTLVVIEVASALVLLAGSSLLMRSFEKLAAIDLGFDPATFLILEAAPVDSTPAAYRGYYSALLQHLQELPDVEAAGAINQLPLLGGSTYSRARADISGSNDWKAIEPRKFLGNYFKALGLPLRAGRFPDDRDRATGACAVLSELAAHRLFPGVQPVGHRVMAGTTWYEVIGIVGDVSHRGPDKPKTPQIYLPYVDAGGEALPTLNGVARGEELAIVVKPRLRAGNLLPRLRDAALSVGPPAVVKRVRAGGESWSDSVKLPRQRTVLFGVLGALGLVLALVGVFGVTSFTVTRRTTEIGIRLAFGAAPGSIVRAMVKEATVPISLGVLLGVGGAAWSSKLIESFLFQTGAHDPLTFIAVSGIIAFAAVVAAWLPARRASRVDPAVALRAE